MFWTRSSFDRSVVDGSEPHHWIVELHSERRLERSGLVFDTTCVREASPLTLHLVFSFPRCIASVLGAAALLPFLSVIFPQ